MAMDDRRNKDVEKKIGAGLRDLTDLELAEIRQMDVDPAGRRDGERSKLVVMAFAVVVMLAVVIGLDLLLDATRAKSVQPTAVASQSSSPTERTRTRSTSPDMRSGSPTPSTTRASLVGRTAPMPGHPSAVVAFPPSGTPPVKALLSVLRQFTAKSDLSIGAAEATASTSLVAISRYLRIETTSGGTNIPVWVVVAQTVENGTSRNLDEAHHHVRSVVIVVAADSTQMVANFESVRRITLERYTTNIFKLY